MKHVELFLFYLATLCLGTPQLGAAQSLSKNIKASIDSIFNQWDAAKTPGAAVAVVKDGQVLYQRAFGMADIGKKESLTTTHSFWVASMSKQFTAMSIALLAEQGKLSLNDDIRKYLPELPFLGDTVRIQHLIHHTSGLRDGFTLIGLTFKGEKHYTNKNVVAVMSKQKSLNFKPNTRYEYLDSGYVLLAEIVVRASGTSFSEFTQQHIFRPLGMNQTKFYGHLKTAIPGLAMGYGVKYKKNNIRYYPLQFKGNTVGSTGLITTLADLIKWNENFYHNKLGCGTQAFIDQIMAPSRLNNGSLGKYAYGLEIANFNEYLVTSHSGEDPGYTAEMVRFSDQKVTVICLANTNNMYSLTQKLLHIGKWVIQNKVLKQELKAIPTNAAKLSNLAGYYLNQENNQDLRIITQEAGKLYAATSLGGYKEPLIQTNNYIFQNSGLKAYELQFSETEDEEKKLLQFVQAREANYTLQKLAPVELSKKQLKPYTGKYFSPELNQTYHIGLRKGKLGLKLFGILFIPFQALEGNRFLADLQGNNCLIFKAASSGNMTGFTFNRRAITNLAFIRKK